MYVLKFGGTSVGTPERMHQVADIVTRDQSPKIVVLSAVSGTTNTLVSIAEHCDHNEKDQATAIADQLKQSYFQFIEELFQTQTLKKESLHFIEETFTTIHQLITQNYSDQVAKMLVVQGELISTRFFSDLLTERSINNQLLMAQDFMTLDENGEPDMALIKQKLKQLKPEKSSLTITQGFIARNSAGGIDNLKRGGSDYTATIIGAVIQSEEVQIWTDIDGLHNNDPRIVQPTYPLANLSFEEASELAYFGAKVLHPHCIIPAQMHGVPVRIKNTMDPEAYGTLISLERKPEAVKAIAAKDGITAIKIKSHRMVMAYGFLKKIFEIFEEYKTPIDMITTSEIAVSLTIDNDDHLKAISEKLQAYGTVEVDQDQSIICIVGDMIAERKGVGSSIFNALDDVPIRMISYGGSRNNISLLVASKHKKDSLQKLHKVLFNGGLK